MFIPNAVPTTTYISRQPSYEVRINRGLSRKGAIIGVTGASKSGKTVLILRTLGGRRGCYVNCALSSTTADIWWEIARQLGIPFEQESETSQANTTTRAATGGGGLTVPFLAKAEASVSSGSEIGQTTASRAVYRSNRERAADVLIDSGAPLVIDDFHYLSRSFQIRLARQIKGLSTRGLNTVISAVTHRGDDPIRANPDLAGRVDTIRLDSWSVPDLMSIAEKGFPALGVSIDRTTFESMAAECGGSPQLMQLFCLKACELKGIMQTSAHEVRVNLFREDLQSIFAEAADSIDFTTVCSQLESGPKERGPRDRYELRDGTVCSIYVAIMKALALDRALPMVSYGQLKDRVNRICKPNDHPRGDQIEAAARRLSEIARLDSMSYTPRREPVLEWLEHRSSLVIPDPYFLLHLRWSRFEGLRAGQS